MRYIALYTVGSAYEGVLATICAKTSRSLQGAYDEPVVLAFDANHDETEAKRVAGFHVFQTIAVLEAALAPGDPRNWVATPGPIADSLMM
ncbi:MAG: hypothetical protein ACYDEY_15720 [Acidimicrobiales bacterium]